MPVVTGPPEEGQAAKVPGLMDVLVVSVRRAFLNSGRAWPSRRGNRPFRGPMNRRG
ncbi:MAG: hypothetical protein AVDCRST_MAG86-498 [uncultured Truepera sp.]|uniref:Uncharacterized protein n=1 Tax=uncultured Truepera sp. TaxID=543023 RepID=A0A6J4URI2_9DEIN|nr:MAG: hypothetical protein AVDCRST_MAG86-498 [uncultured Truepera sp.]